MARRMKIFYEVLYKAFRAPWDIGARDELVALVESGRVRPGTAVDLGSGTASNVVFLARNGFTVTGVDYAEGAVALGRRRAAAAGVDATFVQDDLTDLRHVRGPFDLLVDYGTLDDLLPEDRDRYLVNVLPLTRPGSQFVLYVFEYDIPWWEKAIYRLGLFGAMAVEPGEVRRRFGRHFDIEEVAREHDPSRWPPGYAVYLMTRKDGPAA